MEKIGLVIDNREWAGWQSVQIARGLTQAASAFRLSMTRYQPEGMSLPAPIRAGADVTIRIDDAIALTGFIDTTQVGITATGYSIDVSGRSKTARLIRSSDRAGKGAYRNITMLSLASVIAKPHGITVKTVGWAGNDIVRQVELTPGDTAFAAIERAARQVGCLVTDDSEGHLCLVKVSDAVQDFRLRYGEARVSSWQYTDDASDRATLYRVIGQSAGSNSAFGDSTSSCKGSAADPDWTPQEIVLTLRAEGNATNADCEKRAQWEAKVRRSKAQTLLVTTPTWRSPGGAIWTPGMVAKVELPQVRLNKKMVVQNATLTQDTIQEQATLALVSVDALGSVSD
jgi:prophage tail gpP-like protein